jgi:hypothetical protein
MLQKTTSIHIKRMNGQAKVSQLQHLQLTKAAAPDCCKHGLHGEIPLRQPADVACVPMSLLCVCDKLMLQIEIPASTLRCGRCS